MAWKPARVRDPRLGGYPYAVDRSPARREGVRTILFRRRGAALCDGRRSAHSGTHSARVGRTARGATTVPRYRGSAGRVVLWTLGSSFPCHGWRRLETLRWRSRRARQPRAGAVARIALRMPRRHGPNTYVAPTLNPSAGRSPCWVSRNLRCFGVMSNAARWPTACSAPRVYSTSSSRNVTPV